MKKEGLLGSNTRNRVYRPGSKDVDSIRESIRKARAQKRSTPKTSVSQREKTRDRTDCDRFLEEGFQSAYDGTYEDRCRFLNSLNVLIDETRTEALADPEFFEKLCRHVLRVLTDDHPAIRAMCFHLLRKTMLNERNLVVILTSHVDIYVVRALDLRVENDAERCEAFRLIACMISIYQGSNLKKLIVDSANEKNGKKFAFPKSIMQPVISIALAAMSASWSSVTSSESVYDDKMALPCIGLFCEFCLLEPDHILDMAGTDWIVRVLTGEARTNRRIVTLVAHIIVSWLDDPKMRAKAHLHLVLEQIFAPLIEFGFFQKYDAHAPKPAGRILTDNTGDVLENFKYSFLCILKTWSGLFACAAVGPDSTIMTSSPLRLLEYLGLGTVSPVGGSENLQRIRDMVVDICCEFVDLPYAAKNFVSWEEAAKFYETMHFADTYRASLKYDFILAQNEARLANDAEFTNTVDLVASFRFLALFVLINAGLPQSLARLILATPDSPSGLKASLLLADMLRAAPSIVPSGWRASLLSMPTLVQSACETLASCRSAAAIHHYKTDDLQSFDQQESYTYVNAQNAELVLHRFDQLNGKWIGIAADPTPDDSFLALFIPETLSVGAKRPPLASSPALKKEADFDGFSEDGEDVEAYKGRTCTRSRSLSSLLDCAIIHADNVESNDKGFGSSDSDDDEPNLNWIFTESLLRAINIESSEDRKVASSFAMVSLVSKVFSTLSPLIALEKRPLTSKRRVIVAKLAVEKAAQIIQRGGSSSSEYRSVLFRYAVDFRSALEKRENSRSALSVRNMVYNGSMLTFAIIGAMSSFSCTIDILNEVGVLQMFVDLMTPSTAPEYVKLVISCLNYNIDGLSRVVLSKALTSTNEDARTWSTRFLGLLSSLRLPSFSEWGIKLMLRQLGDMSVKVVRNATTVLHQALPAYPSAARNLYDRIQWSNFGDAGILLRTHSFADEKTCQDNIDSVVAEIDHWMLDFNKSYVSIIDEEMRIALLSIRRSTDGSFARSSGDRPERYPVRLPPHLFAKLATHEVGRRLLVEGRVCALLMRPIQSATSTNKEKANDVVDVPNLKCCLMAMASIGCCDAGFMLLPTEALPKMVKLAESSPVLSVRGVAYWALTIISQCKAGSKALALFGWESNRFRYLVDEVRISERRNSSAANYSLGTPVQHDNTLYTNSTTTSEPFTNTDTKNYETDTKEDGKRHRSASMMYSSGRFLEQQRRRSRSVQSAPSKSLQETSQKVAWHEMTPSQDIDSDIVQRARTMTTATFDSASGHSSAGPVTRTATATTRASTLHDDDISDISRNAELLEQKRMRRLRAASAALFLEDAEVRARTSTVHRCIQRGLSLPKSQLELEAGMADITRAPHFSSRMRKKYHLAPIQQRTQLTINRNEGDPIRYVFMTKDEEREFSAFRKAVMSDDWLWSELRKEDSMPVKPVDALPVYTIVLPAEVQVMCGNIFSRKQAKSGRPAASSVCESPGDRPRAKTSIVNEDEAVEDRGAKSGHGRSQRTDAAQPHSSYRCFHCSGGGAPIVFPDGVDVAAIRRQVLHQVDMLEIKESIPEKRLLGLRQKHSWFFQWPCLYADVLELLDEYRFKPQSRSFLQQIFYDALQLNL